jgi:tetratricopeptide (TPR) repeat protein
VSCSSGRDLTRAEGQIGVGVDAARSELWREAKFRFNRAIEIDPNDALAYNNLAVAYEANGEFEKAREAYLTALKLDRSNEYIQKNYSRFVEFYSRNLKREQKAEEIAGSRRGAAGGEGGEAVADGAPPSADAPETPAAPAAEAEDEAESVELPPASAPILPPVGGEAPAPPGQQPGAPPAPPDPVPPPLNPPPPDGSPGGEA